MQNTIIARMNRPQRLRAGDNPLGQVGVVQTWPQSRESTVVSLPCYMRATYLDGTRGYFNGPSVFAWLVGAPRAAVSGRPRRARARRSAWLGERSRSSAPD